MTKTTTVNGTFKFYASNVTIDTNVTIVQGGLDCVDVDGNEGGNSYKTEQLQTVQQISSDKKVGYAGCSIMQHDWFSLLHKHCSFSRHGSQLTKTFFWFYPAFKKATQVFTLKYTVREKIQATLHSAFLLTLFQHLLYHDCTEISRLSRRDNSCCCHCFLAISISYVF